MTSNAAPLTALTVALDALTSDVLLAFLGKQRWYATKSAAAATVRVVDSVHAPWGDGAYAMVRIGVTAGAEEQFYQLPIALCDSSAKAVPSASIIASIEFDGRRLDVADAVHDPAFRVGLARAVAAGTSAEYHGLTWIADSIGSTRFAVTDNTSTRIAAGEQSNTSIVIDDAAILKLFRLLKPGVHPDLEVTHFLTTRTPFANTPALLGSIALKSAGERTTLGMMQEFLPGCTDAWSYALECGAGYFAAPPNHDAPNAFLTDATRLGAVTRAMHEALASDDDDPSFAPEPADTDDVDRWAHRTQQSIRTSLGLLEKRIASPDFPKERLPEAQALVRRGDHYAGWVNEIDDSLGDDVGMRIRIHGDYHLGQVLRTKQGEFMVIDFEGEPSRTLEERREKTSPLRDVAGMLRSFAYAAATLAMTSDRKLDTATRELRAARWERDVRAAFLEGYLGSPEDRDDHPDVLPEEEEHVRQLIALFEMEKAFYELAYELNNRPAWAWIPMRGIAKLAMR
jgi:maltose alpha-D-glucosyltransferase/alpha-amylase